MPETGKNLGADLYDLLKAGKDNLPSVAAVYGTCKAKVDAAGSLADGAMQRPAEFGGTLGQVHTEWTQLRDVFSKIMGDTQSNLEGTGRALVLASEIFAGSDAEAKNELARLRTTNGEPVPGD